MPQQNVFAVLFTQTALMAHVSPLWSAEGFYSASGIVNFELGLDNERSTSDYWARIRSALREGMASYTGRGKELGLVVSHGEKAENQCFYRILKRY